MSQSGKYLQGSGSGLPVDFIEGNTGGPVAPNGANILFLEGGSAVVTVDGDPLNNILYINLGGEIPQAFDTDSGTAIPDSGVLDILGGDAISTSGATNVVTISVSGQTEHALSVGTASGAITPLSAATNGQLPIGSTGADPVVAAITSGNNLTVTNGAGSITLDVTGTTNHAIQVGNATGSLTSLAAATDGQIPIGSTGVDPVVANITAGTNVTITNGAGSITIDASSTSQIANYTAVIGGGAAYTVLSTDYYISADVTPGVITIRLPNAPSTGRLFVVKDSVGQAATNNITITTVAGSIDIDGSFTFVMNTAYESVNLIFNGSAYEVF